MSDDKSFAGINALMMVYIVQFIIPLHCDDRPSSGSEALGDIVDMNDV